MCSRAMLPHGSAMIDTSTLLREDPPERDNWGLQAVRRMLEDLRFPRTGEELTARAGAWRVPMPGGTKLRLGDLLAPVESERFRTPADVARALEDAWPDLRHPHGPWKVQEQDEDADGPDPDAD